MNTTLPQAIEDRINPHVAGGFNLNEDESNVAAYVLEELHNLGLIEWTVS